MSIRTVLVSTGLLAVVCGIVSSQQPTPPSGTPPQTPPGFPQLPLPGATPVPPPVTPPGPSRLDFSSSGAVSIPPVPAKPTPPPEKTVEELLNELERVQAQKAELEKKEQELKVTVRKKLEQQTERLNKLGVTPKDTQPNRVGKIIIEGNTKTPDKKILDVLALHPGQVLQYPRLEDARIKLQKTGFRSVAVEVVANELDDTFMDIRIRVEEPEPKPVAPQPKPRLP